MEMFLHDNWHILALFTAFGGLLWRIFSRYADMDKRVSMIERDIKQGRGNFQEIKKSLNELSKDVQELNTSVRVIIQALRGKGIINGTPHFPYAPPQRGSQMNQ